MKCVDQIPAPPAAAAKLSHIGCTLPSGRFARDSRLSAVKQPQKQMSTAKATNRRSCSWVTQSYSLIIQAFRKSQQNGFRLKIALSQCSINPQQLSPG